MAQIGYARVSTTDQSLEIQLDQLREAGCDHVFGEQLSGQSMVERQALRDALDQLNEGDVLVVTRLDRLARSMLDLLRILNVVAEKNATFRCLHQALDTSTSEGRLMLTILGAFAEFELDIRKARQREGIEKAKREGKYKGRADRPRKVTRAKVAELKAQGLSCRQIARALKCGATAVYRAHPEGWGLMPAHLRRKTDDDARPSSRPPA